MIGSPRPAACSAIERDSSSSRRLQRALIDVARDLHHQLAAVVLEQQEAALGVGQLDDGVDDGLEQARQAQLAVEALVDAQEAAQAALGLSGARGQRGAVRVAGGITRVTGRAPQPARLRIGGEPRAVLFRRCHADLLEDVPRQRARGVGARAIPLPFEQPRGEQRGPPRRRPPPGLRRAVGQAAQRFSQRHLRQGWTGGHARRQQHARLGQGQILVVVGLVAVLGRRGAVRLRLALLDGLEQRRPGRARLAGLGQRLGLRQRRVAARAPLPLASKRRAASAYRRAAGAARPSRRSGSPSANSASPSTIAPAPRRAPSSRARPKARRAAPASPICPNRLAALNSALPSSDVAPSRPSSRIARSVAPIASP